MKLYISLSAGPELEVVPQRLADTAIKQKYSNGIEK